MKIISHRGNVCGPVPDKENRPSYIDVVIQMGYEVEVDIRYINDEFWLGHDRPEYKIEMSWMKLRKDYIWYHCKDQNSVIKFLELNDGFKYFCHKKDDYVLTSTGHIWVHDLCSDINEKCIIPLLNLSDIQKYENSTPGFICTDFIKQVSLPNLNTNF